MGITTVRALRDADTALIRREFSVVLERTVQELRGVSCLALEEAVSTYIARAAEKLRRQHSLANAVQVYIRTNPFSEKQPQYQRGITVPLTQATSDTMRLTRAVLWGLKRIYRPGFAYQKAGVMLMDLHGEDQAQGILFAVSAPARPAQTGS